MGTAWVIPSNPEMYDSDAAFRELTEITWSETGPGIVAGDTVYIYLSSPVSAIATKCHVVATKLVSDQIVDDYKFWRDREALAKRQARRSWMILRRSVIFDNDTRARLSFTNLQSHGLRGSMSGRQRLPQDVVAYVRDVEASRRADDVVAESSEVDQELVDGFVEQVAQGEYSVEDRLSTTKTRGSAQRAFADVVKANYGYRCAVTGITTREFLVASHIVPWADDETIRLDPSNGICLSTLVDRAFDTGYLEIDDNLTVRIRRDRVNDESLQASLGSYDGRTLEMPSQDAPRAEHLRRRLDVLHGSDAANGEKSGAFHGGLRPVNELPANAVVPLTDIDTDGGRLADYGPDMYCSTCGKNSQRLRRNELWAIRHKTRDNQPGPIRTYCRQHLANRDWQANGEDLLSQASNEIHCSDCLLVVRAGSLCDATGEPHETNAGRCSSLGRRANQ